MSRDHTTALQPGQQSETPYKKKIISKYPKYTATLTMGNMTIMKKGAYSQQNL